MSHNTKQQWRQYVAAEIKTLTPILGKHGYTLDKTQPHIRGERFLMQSVNTASGKKLILYGTHAQSGARVVIKATTDSRGKKELEHERTCRTLLKNIHFAYKRFHMPNELLFIETDNMLISIQEYIEQTSTFLERSTPEQFTLCLQAFKTQEGAHATTRGHFKTIAHTFGYRTSIDYVTLFEKSIQEVVTALPDDTDIHTTLQQTKSILIDNVERIEQYCGFLTHTDFVPHNFRIKNGQMYLLDFSSLLFGNKYEGWARFVNFMALYNPELEQALEQYIADNRPPEEAEALHLMRLYRLGEIIRYYAGTLADCSGDLLQLNTARVDFWHKMLKAKLAHTSLPEQDRTSYIQLRDSLRCNGEKERQKGLL